MDNVQLGLGKGLAASLRSLEKAQGGSKALNPNATPDLREILQTLEQLAQLFRVFEKLLGNITPMSAPVRVAGGAQGSTPLRPLIMQPLPAVGFAGGQVGGNGVYAPGTTERKGAGQVVPFPASAGTSAAGDAAVNQGIDAIRSRYGQFILPQEKGAKSVAFSTSNGGAAGLTNMLPGRPGDKITMQPISDSAYRRHVAAHEYIHSVTSSNFAKSFSNDQLEGITDLMAQNVTGHDHSVYGKERAQARAVQSIVGQDTMARAIFSGDPQAIAKIRAAYASLSR